MKNRSETPLQRARSKPEFNGRLDFKDYGSRLTVNRPEGMKSFDLGAIRWDEAIRLARVEKVALYVGGRELKLQS